MYKLYNGNRKIMLIGKIHPGSGLGDQLFSYIITRVIALDKGYDFGFVGKEFFKGKDFMNLDWGKEVKGVLLNVNEQTGELLTLGQPDFPRKFKFDKPYYDPEVNFIEDGTIIDGTGAQDERYWGHRLDEIREWLKVDRVMDNFNRVCVINFRGGEYASVPDLFLPKEYWEQAKQIMKNKYPEIQEFIVRTDDVNLAKQFFPNDMILNYLYHDWVSILQAKYLIISNSAFAILPALLNENLKEVIAPKYWAGRNVGEWRRPQNYYKKFTYI